MPSSRLLAGGLLALLTTTAIPALAVTDDDLLKDDQTAGDVLTNGLGYKAQRYSPLDRINRTTVTTLPRICPTHRTAISLICRGIRCRSVSGNTPGD
jgi:hypothetical protein